MKLIFSSNNKGYTLLELMIVIFMLMMILTITSIVYISLVRATILANDYYQALENVKLGTEKIWRALKHSYNLQVGTSTIDFQIFKEGFCVTTTISFADSKLNYCQNSSCTSVFDENLVTVIDFRTATDTPNTEQRSSYYQYAPKIVILYYNLELKSRKGITTTLEFEQAVAPLNSTLNDTICR